MKTKTTITEITQEDLVNLLSTATYGSSEFDADEADALMQIIMFGSLIYA